MGNEAVPDEMRATVSIDEPEGVHAEIGGAGVARRWVVGRKKVGQPKCIRMGGDEIMHFQRIRLTCHRIWLDRDDHLVKARGVDWVEYRRVEHRHMVAGSVG